MSTKSQLSAMKYLATVNPKKYKIETEGKSVFFFEHGYTYLCEATYWKLAIKYDFYGDKFYNKKGWR